MHMIVMILTLKIAKLQSNLGVCHSVFHQSKKVFAILLMDADASGQTSEVEATRKTEALRIFRFGLWLNVL